MLKIVGGSYLEICHFPYWRQIYGSGGRAAAAVSHMCGGLELYTCIGPERIKDLETLAASFRFKLKPELRPQTVSFEYFHGLSTPVIWPPAHTFTKRPTLDIQGQTVLRYGMIEADAVVQAEYAVYDPQSVFDPRLFHENGSYAQHLAVVLNLSEGRKLTHKRDPDAVATSVLQRSHAEVVVLKQGAHGALVVTARGRKANIPAYQTPLVFPIGSGDVFSAAFAAKWATKKIDPVTAAAYASLAAAFYCSTRTLPLPKTPEEIKRRVGNLKRIKLNPRSRRPRVYLAGPFFNIGQRWLIEEAKAALESQGIEVFSPFHDVGFGRADHVVPEDLKGLHGVDVVFAIVDGLDAGTLFEIGYARARGTPVVAFVEQEHDESLKLLEGSNCMIESDFTTSIYRASWLATTA